MNKAPKTISASKLNLHGVQVVNHILKAGEVVYLPNDVEPSYEATEETASYMKAGSVVGIKLNTLLKRVSFYYTITGDDNRLHTYQSIWYNYKTEEQLGNRLKPYVTEFWSDTFTISGALYGADASNGQKRETIKDMVFDSCYADMIVRLDAIRKGLPNSLFSMSWGKDNPKGSSFISKPCWNEWEAEGSIAYDDTQLDRFQVIANAGSNKIEIIKRGTRVDDFPKTFPDIVFKSTGKQNRFNSYLTAFVPEKYKVGYDMDADFSENDLAQACAWNMRYWGGNTNGYKDVDGGKLYTIEANKD